MSVEAKHYINGTYFVPVNNDDFTLNFERDPSVPWSNDISATNTVELPKEGYDVLRNHLETIGIQGAINYDIKVGNTTYNFISDLTQNVSFRDSSAKINIERYRGKDDVIKNISSITYELLFQEGRISQADMVNIPYVIIKQNQGELILNSSIMIYFVSTQLAESIANGVRLIAELVAAVTPSIVVSISPGTTINIGMIIRYSLLITLEIAKAILYSIALTKLTKDWIEIVYPKVRNFKAMTVDKLLTIGLAKTGITYQSTLKSEFRKCTILPIPIDFKNKKWWEVLESEDDRILNRGYPTSSDTTPTVMSLIDEIEKMFNLKPVMRGNVLHLEPKGTVVNPNPTIIQNNFNLQDALEQEFTINCDEMWACKIISYTNDMTDIMLYDNPKGLRVEYNAYTDVGQQDLRRIYGRQESRINFALGTIKKSTKLESIVKETASRIDSFLGTNLLQKAKKRDGILAISQTQFNITKMLYQVNGKQTADYFNRIGADALYTKYHYMDTPANSCYRVYNEMPLGMNNETFSGIISDNDVVLETGESVNVLTASYNLNDADATVSYRKKELIFAKNIKTRKVYAE